MDQTIKVTSKKFALNVWDFLKGAGLAVGAAVATALEHSFESGAFTINWKPIAVTAAATFFAYLVKNFFTPAKVEKQITNDQVESAKAGNLEEVAK